MLVGSRWGNNSDPASDSEALLFLLNIQYDREGLFSRRA